MVSRHWNLAISGASWHSNWWRFLKVRCSYSCLPPNPAGTTGMFNVTICSWYKCAGSSGISTGSWNAKGLWSKRIQFVRFESERVRIYTEHFGCTQAAAGPVRQGLWWERRDWVALWHSGNIDNSLHTRHHSVCLPIVFGAFLACLPTTLQGLPIRLKVLPFAKHVLPSSLCQSLGKLRIATKNWIQWWLWLQLISRKSRNCLHQHDMGWSLSVRCWVLGTPLRNSARM